MAEYKTKVNDRKVEAVDAIKTMLASAEDYIFTDYRGLTVEQITDLRSKLRENDAEYRVVKNNFAKIAFQQLEKPDVADYFVGPTAVALSKSDATVVLKTLIDFAKETSVEIKGALVGDAVFDAAQTEALSRLPGRDQLIAQLMSVMQAPLQNLVYALNAIPTDLARVLQAVADKKQSEE